MSKDVKLYRRLLSEQFKKAHVITRGDMNNNENQTIEFSFTKDYQLIGLMQPSKTPSEPTLPPLPDPGIDDGGLPPVEPEPPVINCIPTSFNVTQIQGDATKKGNVIVVASIWYEGKEYPYITTADQMAYLIPNVTSAKLRFGGGFRTGILMHYDAYNVYPEYCKALVIARNTTDNYFVAGASNDNLVLYPRTANIWDGGGSSNRIFKSETRKAINEPSEIRLTKLSPEMTQFIKTHGGDTGVFLNGNYNVNNLVDMVNQGNDIVINACVKVESNLLPSLEPAIV